MAALSTDDAKGGSGLESRGGGAGPAEDTSCSANPRVWLHCKKKPAGGPTSFPGLYLHPYQHHPITPCPSRCWISHKPMSFSPRMEVARTHKAQSVGLCRPCFQMGCDNFHTFVSNYSSCLCSHGQRHWSYQKNDARCSKSWSPLCISFNLSLPTAALQKAVSGLLLVGWFLLVSSLYLFMAHLYTFVLVPAFYFSFNYSCTWAPLQDGGLFPSLPPNAATPEMSHKGFFFLNFLE